jgi:hypothetical protein
LANAALGIHDLLVSLFLYKLLIAIFFGKSVSDLKPEEMSSEEQYLLKTLNIVGKASFEFGLDQALLITSFTPSFISTSQKVANNFIDVLFEDNYLLKNFVIDNISGVKDFAEVEIVS